MTILFYFMFALSPILGKTVIVQRFLEATDHLLLWTFSMESFKVGIGKMSIMLENLAILKTSVQYWPVFIETHDLA